MPLRNDRHRVVVLLTVENYVQARLMELLHGDAVGALGEDLDLVDTFLFRTLGIFPLTFAYLRRRDEAQYLDKSVQCVVLMVMISYWSKGNKGRARLIQTDVLSINDND